MTSSRRVLCIGLDGATFDVLLPWMEDGTLPNLASIKQSGSWGNLESTIPPLTAPAWISFMTGQNPGNHGIFHFLDLSDDRSRARGERRLVDIGAMQSPALWDILAHEGGRVGLMNIPMTYPPRPVNGFMITGMMTPPGAPCTYPADLESTLTDYKIDIDRFSGKRPFARDSEDPPGVDDVDGLIRDYHRLMLDRSETAVKFLQQEPWDFFMVVYTGTDRLGHYAWLYHGEDEKGAGSKQDNDRRQAVRDYYRVLDQQIGRLIETAGPDAVTVVMSDHGMGPAWTRRVHLNEWLYREGLLRLSRTNGRKTSPDEWMLRFRIPRDRVARLVRALPIPKRAMKRAAGATAIDIDYDASLAYYVHVYNHIGGIRINAPTEDERQSIASRLLGELPALRDEEMGNPIFRSVVPRSEVYRGPHTEKMPDLITITDPDYAINTRVSHRSSLVTPRREVEIPGAHRDDGIFMSAGPGIRHNPAPIQDLRIEDLAPTILYLLDCPVPEAMDGRVMSNVLEPGGLEMTPVRMAPGTGSGRWPGNGVDRSISEEPEEDDERLLEHLKALGYL